MQDTPPDQFVKMLSTGEIVVGATLLTPFVPTGVAGAALAGFAGLLGRLYWQTPGLHEEGSLRPTEQGTPVAKDVWMLAIGSALVLDALADHLPGRKRSAG